MTMGIPREIRQAGEWDLARAIGHGLGTGLQNAGWEASGFDPPEPWLAAGAGTRPDGTKLEGWTLRLILDQLWCDGYFNEYSFKLGLRLHLLDPSGRLRSRAELRKEYVEEYKHPADFAYQVEVKTREALSALLIDVGLANFPPTSEVINLGPRRAPLSRQDGSWHYRPVDPNLPPEDEDAEDPGEAEPASACPKCARPAAKGWKHCPDCGTSLLERK